MQKTVQTVQTVQTQKQCEFMLGDPLDDPKSLDDPTVHLDDPRTIPDDPQKRPSSRKAITGKALDDVDDLDDKKSTFSKTNANEQTLDEVEL
jgi:hypothetical protein